ncbi:MAG: cation-transporting P-type ATPase, partial [Burkholderiales bacterium]|nr:cation-transporting P-type ATPase [Burkholderiales bacterium]
MTKTEAIGCCDSTCGGGVPAVASPVPAGVEPALGATLFRIRTMDCPLEEAQIRQALGSVADIQGLRFQLGARTLAITAPAVAVAQALEAMRRIGFDPQPVTTPGAKVVWNGHGHDHDHDHDHPPASAPASAGLRPLLIALALALAAEAVAVLGGHATVGKGIEMALALAAIGFAGFDTYSKGFVALRRGRLNINALMTVAVTGAFLIGRWPEAATVMALYAIAELIEARSVDRARNAIERLLDLAPQQADVRQADGNWKLAAAADVPLHAIVRIRPGERVPLDGIVTTGTSAIN